jgi:hypothetical protein
MIVCKEQEIITEVHPLRLWTIACSAVLLMAVEPVWKKPIPSWTVEDARQILANSPWSKPVVAGVTRLPGEDQRREGGNMGQPQGVGYDGLDDKRNRTTLPASLLGPDAKRQPTRSQVIRLVVRWESALPIRSAELKDPEAAAPILSEDGYSIAVYGVPGTYFGDPKSLGNPLKDLAALKREGKKDVKPSSVEVFQLERGATVLYRFPLSAQISPADHVIVFTALIGRLQVSQTFNLDEMQFQGKLEL